MRLGRRAGRAVRDGLRDTGAPRPGRLHREHHRDEKQAQHAEETVDEHGDGRLPLLVGTAPGGIPGLDHVPTGGTEKERVEELGDQGDPDDVPSTHEKALLAEDLPPTPGTQGDEEST